MAMALAVAAIELVSCHAGESVFLWSVRLVLLFVHVFSPFLFLYDSPLG
jgi:hypothetical protein